MGAALDLTPVINNPNFINLEPGSLIQAKEVIGEAAGGIKASCATEIKEIVEATAERGFDPLKQLQQHEGAANSKAAILVGAVLVGIFFTSAAVKGFG